MYCEERFGLLVDCVLQRLLLEKYCEPLDKIPTAVLERTQSSAALFVDQQAKKIRVREMLADELIAELNTVLYSANAIRVARDLHMRNEEIKALQNCPVCKCNVRLDFQNPAGFKISCAGCGTERYLRGLNGTREYEQLVAGERNFRIHGRRAWAMSLGA